MNGLVSVPMPDGIRVEIVQITPAIAKALLRRNKCNRALRQQHVRRIARLMVGGRWRFNGDTIAIDANGFLANGQHRLTAIVLTGISQTMIIVFGVSRREAFATIDAARLSRSFGDVVNLAGGGQRYHQVIGSSLAWLLRHDRGILVHMRDADQRIENDEIEDALEANPGIEASVKAVMPLVSIIAPSMLAAIHYILVRGGQGELAARMVDTMLDPTRTLTTDPFFKLRYALQSAKDKGRRDPIVTWAIIVKALAAAHRGEPVHALSWKRSGQRIEAFPTLDFLQEAR